VHKVQEKKKNDGFTGLLNSESLCPNGGQKENDERRKPGQAEGW
jgi:hypothetical protein